MKFDTRATLPIKIITSILQKFQGRGVHKLWFFKPARFSQIENFKNVFFSSFNVRFDQFLPQYGQPMIPRIVVFGPILNSLDASILSNEFFVVNFTFVFRSSRHPSPPNMLFYIKGHRKNIFITSIFIVHIHVHVLICFLVLKDLFLDFRIVFAFCFIIV